MEQRSIPFGAINTRSLTHVMPIKTFNSSTSDIIGSVTGEDYRRMRHFAFFVGLSSPVLRQLNDQTTNTR